MTRFEISDQAYPELVIAALRDELRRTEREAAIRDAARLRRSERWAVRRAVVGRWFGRSGRG